MQVLYPLLSQRGGEPGRAWAQRCLSEHRQAQRAAAGGVRGRIAAPTQALCLLPRARCSMVEQSIAECLALRR